MQRSSNAALVLLALCAASAAARPVPLAPANAAAADLGVQQQQQQAVQRQLMEQHAQQALLVPQEPQHAPIAGPIRRALVERFVPTTSLSMLSANDAKGAIMAATDIGTPDAAFWATQRNQANTWLVANGGNYALAGLAGPRGGYPYPYYGY